MISVNGGKAGRQKEQRSLAKGKRYVAEYLAQEGHSELDDTSDVLEGERTMQESMMQGSMVHERTSRRI